MTSIRNRLGTLEAKAAGPFTGQDADLANSLGWDLRLLDVPELKWLRSCPAIAN